MLYQCTLLNRLNKYSGHNVYERRFEHTEFWDDRWAHYMII